MKPSLDAVAFDATGYKMLEDLAPGKIRPWQTPEGDFLGLYFFPIPPDLPSDAPSVGDLAARLGGKVREGGGKLVELNVITAGGCCAVWMIVSIPQRPSGRTYIGVLTLPFRDFSFQLKCQCEERGTTGLREAILAERSMAAGKMPVKGEDGRVHIPDFDPDAEKYDAQFPHHPISRVRRVLAHVAKSLVVVAEVRELPRLTLPQNFS